MTYSTLSVVIPTTLGSQLISTVNSILSSSYPIREIIVVYPSSLESRINFFDSIRDSVLFVSSDIASQVSQRFIGFQHASSQLVLQADDDIIFCKDSIFNLVSSFQAANSISLAISPCYYNKNTGKPVHQISPVVKSIFRVVFGINRLYGAITPFSSSYGVDPLSCSPSYLNLVECQWLPGGCILHHRSNLQFSIAQFPYGGKAYCEDLIDSYSRTQNCIIQFVCLSSNVYIDPPSIPSTPTAILADFRARYYFVRLSSRNLLLFFLWSFFSYSRRFLVSLSNFFHKSHG